MSTTVPATMDTLPTNVPKLDIKGTNWAIFSLRFQIAVEAKVAEKHENLAKHLLTQHIPDSTALCVRNLSNVVTMWKEIVREYTKKGAYAQTDLCTKFLELKCPGGGDVRTFLDKLRAKRDKLYGSDGLVILWSRRQGRVTEVPTEEEGGGNRPCPPCWNYNDTEERSNFISSDEDWFSEIDENNVPSMSDWETDLAIPSSGSDTDSSVELAAEVGNGHSNGTIAELYNSGTTRHISPYRDQFNTLTPHPT
ncbi:hypothetical protein DFJ58DRAFT_849614 [Suillus subalutaceus]|uniref:uncharacterized protein n=1 Tax=Suillus subalutaceus TaxID=48586 RepID=UPI001B861435|nr:uncharacterized protein DFJ58DRAFT_849614 [Suillus subalutaceus]KAG1825137.1 hypothetical protein DFJ58DRAFT_849614 [Suillus subalutaceus]